jgi:hypothetical protein
MMYRFKGVTRETQKQCCPFFENGRGSAYQKSGGVVWYIYTTTTSALRLRKAEETIWEWHD